MYGTDGMVLVLHAVLAERVVLTKNMVLAQSVVLTDGVSTGRTYGTDGEYGGPRDGM